MSALTMMKTLIGHFCCNDLRDGLFILTLTDLHQSNTFVNKNWHITSIVDLEWACTRPIEMQHPPYWLTDQAVDTVDCDAYNTMCEEFIVVFEQEEKKISMAWNKGAGFAGTSRYTRLMRKGWDKGKFWYSLALDSPTGLHAIFYDHIQPLFDAGHADNAAFYQIMSRYWPTDADKFIDTKVKDKEEYDNRLKKKRLK
ncbi:MAG: hypothetical protein M1818_007380 [Claussenomyces sp. TS43310]|nr:MAG: hypothetical protein M1818_007380 [Claussenomyces sp. TS43310]